VRVTASSLDRQRVVFRRTNARKGRHISVTPANSATRHLSYGRIRLDAEVPEVSFDAGAEEVGLVCLQGAAAITVDGQEFTVGRYELRAPARTVEGRYLTVWRRDAAGRWRALFDHGLENPLPPGAVRAPVAVVQSRDGDLEAAIGTWSALDGWAATGTYLAVRRRGPDGAWTALVETGATSPP
jgi:hypothetical protein